MDKERNGKRTFAHFHWCIDADNYEWVFLQVELIDGVPSVVYLVPITKPYLKCHIYPYIRN
jgi:hypothetical protein